ncbi:hypothetical protein ACIFOT_21000 [Neobacillus sp. NRS-1170]|uniref:hypothetical protein n=1 Tax=Neobacillus sp. NRS-1170 TaxID=3233898 RepID=UPI003D2BF512
MESAVFGDDAAALHALTIHRLVGKSNLATRLVLDILEKIENVYPIFKIYSQ